MTSRLQLGQFFTPAWAAEALVEQHFGDLTLCDTLLEPSCGPVAFLSALPDHVPALGVEIDPELAGRAKVNTGRAVLVGDFTEIELPVRPTAIIGNPPFRLTTIEAFLRRARPLLPEDNVPIARRRDPLSAAAARFGGYIPLSGAPRKWSGPTEGSHEKNRLDVTGRPSAHCR